MQCLYREAPKSMVFTISDLSLEPVAPVAQLVTSKSSDGRVAGSHLGAVTLYGFSSVTMPKSGQRPYRGYTSFDFTVDEGSGLFSYREELKF